MNRFYLRLSKSLISYLAQHIENMKQLKHKNKKNEMFFDFRVFESRF